MSVGLQGFWLVGVTLSWALAFKVPMGVIGLWIGTAVGDSTCGTLVACAVPPALNK